MLHVILLKCSVSEPSSRPPSLHLVHLILPSLKLPSSVSRLPLSALHHLLPFPSLHVSFPSPPAAPLCPPQPCSLSATRPHCLWRVIDFLPALEMRAARARLEVTHFPGAFSSLLINHSLGPPHSLLIQAAIRANSPFEKSVNRLAGRRAGRLQRRIFAQRSNTLLRLFELLNPRDFVPSPLCFLASRGPPSPWWWVSSDNDKQQTEKGR